MAVQLVWWRPIRESVAIFGEYGGRDPIEMTGLHDQSSWSQPDHIQNNARIRDDGYYQMR